MVPNLEEDRDLLLGMVFYIQIILLPASCVQPSKKR